MTSSEFEWLQRNTMALEAIHATLQAIRLSLMQDHIPNYQYDLSAFPGFDWNVIGAQVTERDRYGVSSVSWAGHIYLRRSPQNKFGDDIWFSRCTGKGEKGENVYQRLITFTYQLRSAEPVPERVMRHLAVGA